MSTSQAGYQTAQTSGKQTIREHKREEGEKILIVYWLRTHKIVPLVVVIGWSK